MEFSLWRFRETVWTGLKKYELCSDVSFGRVKASWLLHVGAAPFLEKGTGSDTRLHPNGLGSQLFGLLGSLLESISSVHPHKCLFPGC